MILTWNIVSVTRMSGAKAAPLLLASASDNSRTATEIIESEFVHRTLSQGVVNVNVNAVVVVVVVVVIVIVVVVRTTIELLLLRLPFYLIAIIRSQNCYRCVSTERQPQKIINKGTKRPEHTLG